MAPRRYAHEGVLIRTLLPTVPAPGVQPNFFLSGGFVLVRIIKRNVFLVQTRNTNELLFVKLVHRVNRPGIHGIQPGEFMYDEPPEFRISTAEAATVLQLPSDPPQFTRLRTYQNNNEHWALYFEYCNGGTLESFRDQYYQKGWRVPEHFIWHVMAELCWALSYLHFGIATNMQNLARPSWEQLRPADGWRPCYHRDLDMSNILLHFRPRRGQLAAAGYKPNAFPEVRLADFSDSASILDNAHHLRPGKFPNEPIPNAWEDVYQLGRILRSLCMTHVRFPMDDEHNPNNVIPNQIKDESLRWDHRPDSRRLDHVNAIPGNGGQLYSSELMRILREFEWQNQENAQVDSIGNKGNAVQDMAWVAGYLLPTAHDRIREYTRGRKRNGFYTELDVSWAKPWGPMPMVIDRADPNLDATLENAGLLGPDSTAVGVEPIGLEYVAPNVTENLGGP
ncbi:kinase-like domain-containing protein [Hypoxylon trugodes]|uniref:kinase-like domain-containing protein n=1 Tax=Hypoxylon trugodes TaxID=326681 RepID=UPI00219B9B0E|nr:kinase-like domain-containing protein [Hypoxylon trugodes]KAI1393295.1 kinase-like domain-containing protein [Hypoxylon trugodes]